MSWRIKSLVFLFGLTYLGVAFYFYNLQINKGAYYLSKAQAQQGSAALQTRRGAIYFTDKDGADIPVAIDKEFPMIYGVPTEIQKNGGLAEADLQRLSFIVNIPTSDLNKKFSRKGDQFELLVNKAIDSQVNDIDKLGIKGIYSQNHLLRSYPYNKTASQVLGFVEQTDKGENGKYGAELYFNGDLAGDKDVHLTIDQNIQNEAEDLVKKLISQYGAVAGSAIVQDPSTGKILAMASLPDFDPNNYSQFDISTFLNRMVQNVYEPGSVFKLITMAAGIDSGKLTPDTTYTDTGSFTANGKTITNWDYTTHGAYGLVTMSNVIEHSINTGAVYAERKTGPDIFYNYLIKFGFNQLTNIDLPGEVKGNLNNLKSPNGKDIDFVTAAYGQGVAVTPIELISAISAIANGGSLMKPIIVQEEEPQVVRQAISQDTAKKISAMMVSAVRKNVLADIPNYSVAGKTGTAFVPDFNNGGYTDQVINTYAGFAPASNPKFVITIRLDKPAGSPLAGETVVPAFRELTQFLLNYYNIAPDKI